ncbi:MAG: SagB/ThcOx family dehydrogenase [Myxococcales bacterium]
MLSKLLASFVGHLKPDRVAERSTRTIELPPPERTGGEPLMSALARRRSERSFQKTPLPPQTLSNLLWAAFGINRPETGDRTAPSALNAQEVDVYAAMAQGLYIYAPKTHSLRLVAEVDARAVTGYQDFVDEAPLDLVYVADRGHTLAAVADHDQLYAAVCAGAIAENVYLYCASAGLSTVVRALFDRKALGSALRLAKHEEVLLTQTVGYPK